MEESHPSQVEDLKGDFNQIREELLDLSPQPNYLLVLTKALNLTKILGREGGQPFLF